MKDAKLRPADLYSDAHDVPPLRLSHVSNLQRYSSVTLTIHLYLAEFLLCLSDYGLVRRKSSTQSSETDKSKFVISLI
jgi:hypothetical protein